MLAQFTFILSWAVLFAGLTLPIIAPGTANVANIVIMGLGIIVLFLRPATRPALRHVAVVLPLTAGLVLTVALLPTARSALHVLAVLVLAPLYLVGPHSAVLQRLGHRLTPTLIASFALAGASAAALIAAFDVLALGYGRGGASVNNPIHLADLALMLGFAALMGLSSAHRWRVIFLAGPFMALMAVWFSGSRGPLLAFGVMLVTGGSVLAFQYLSRQRAMAVILIGGLVLSTASVGVLSTGIAGRMADVGQLGSMASGQSADASVAERLYLYRSAFNAFLASPIYGHGLIDYTQSAARYAPPGPSWPPSGHLHNDIADFAVIGGSLGLLAYALLLVAPLVAGLSTQGRWRKPAIYLGSVASIGYFSMGLTNAMFGILTQTTLYAIVLSLIVSLALASRDIACDHPNPHCANV